jgi:hypothetical protein
MGATAGLISAASTGAQIGFGFMQHQTEAQAASLRGRFENDVAERNAQLAERQGRDAIGLGDLEARRLGGQTDQAISTERAATAGQNVDVSGGSAAAVRASQQLVGNVDELTIRNNAARQAWGYDVEAANQRMNGRLALLAGENEAAGERLASVSTLLSGASSLYGLYKTRIPKGYQTTTLPGGQPANDSFFGPNQAPG